MAVTGAIDLVSDGSRCYVIRNGRPEMGKSPEPAASCPPLRLLTGGESGNCLEAAAAAVCLMGLAGEIGF